MDITTCIFCGEICEEPPTKRGWSSVGKYAKGLHFDCAEKVASQGRQLSPSPQTGEKDEGFQIRVLKLMIEKLCGCYETMFERYSGLESLDLETVREYLGPLNGMRGMLRDWDSKITSPHQPPAAQSDQEAAEKDIVDNLIYTIIEADDNKDPYSLIRDKVIKIIKDAYTTLPGQPVDAVAFAEWASWNNWVYQPETKKWFNKDLFMKEEAKDKTTADLYALFTARHPTPEPGSHDY